MTANTSNFKSEPFSSDFEISTSGTDFKIPSPLDYDVTEALRIQYQPYNCSSCNSDVYVPWMFL